jgi:predicted regulator of Ras-like GTPase activity (Roadblock/LC7/MglB family)
MSYPDSYSMPQQPFEQPYNERRSRASRMERLLNDLLNSTPEIEAASVVSFDGLPMASALPANFDEDRVAAMSAAMLSLGERATQGLGRGGLSQVHVEGERGTVFLVSAEDAVLVAIAGAGAKVGMLRYEVRHAAQRLAEALRAPEPEPVQAFVEQPAVEPTYESTPLSAMPFGFEASIEPTEPGSWPER